MPVIPPPYENYSIQLTGKQIVTDALDLLGANDVASEPEVAMLQRDLRTLNSMLDAWNTEGLIPWAKVQFRQDLVSGTSAYVIGPAETFDTFRLNKVEQGEAFIKSSDFDYQLEVLTSQQWAEIPDRSIRTGCPSAVYYEPSTTNGTLNFYPTPDQTYTFTLFRCQLLAQITNLNEIFYLPPGYAEAIVNHLAIRLAAKTGRPVPQEVVEVATNAKANLKRLNLTPEPVRCDSAMVGRGWYDIYSGMYRTR